MPWVVVDVEADGASPFDRSMVCFGAVVVEPGLTRIFEGLTAPVHPFHTPEALAVSGFTREEHEAFPDPAVTMAAFRDWVKGLGKGRPIFVSDNPAFDWQWINGYMHRYCDENPFGHSGRRIGDLYSGFKADASKASEWKALRKRAHTHNPVDDAYGNAEALLAIRDMGLKLPGVPRT